MGNRVTYSIEVLGKPQGKDRPRMSRKSNTIYTTQKTKNYEHKVGDAWIVKYHKEKLIGAIEVEMEMFFPLNQSDSKRVKQAKLDGDVKATVKPDIDNIIKCILDGLNGIAYDDDKQIISVTAVKLYSETPRVEIRMREV